MNASRSSGHGPAPHTAKRTTSQQSLNHLLNFSLPPRVQPISNTPRRSRKAIHHQVWNKEKFVNAQYRFVMRPTGDYTVHFADPDIYFQWQDILQVIIARSPLDDTSSQAGVTMCPICLSPPTAPRMTKCGHVFCYPCILHYLETSDNAKWHRCPICFDSITSSQLKPVQWSYVPSSRPPINSTLSLRLVQRPQITTLALPRSDTWPLPPHTSQELIPPHEAPFHFLPDVQEFAKFMLATPDQYIASIMGDISELETEEALLTSMNDELGLAFVLRAKEKCRGMLAKAQELDMDTSLQGSIARKQRGMAEAASQAAARRRREAAAIEARQAPDGASQVPVEFLSTQSATIPTLASSPPTARSVRTKRNVNPPPPSNSSYFYYQAADGANIFLHPLDIRILLAHFGSYSSFPNNIDVLITFASEGTVDDDLRRRCKYLAHLPEGADVVFVETDLEGIVGADGLKPFENMLKIRTTKRKDKAKKEDKARIKAEERERESALSTIADRAAGFDRRPNASATNDLSWMERYRDDRAASPDLPALHDIVEVVSSSPESGGGDAIAPPQPPVPRGAWGSRSFATTAANAGAAEGEVIRPEARARQVRDQGRGRIDDDWEYDQAWHDLEEVQLSGGGGVGRGGRKGRKRLVLLGGGGRQRA